MRRSNKYNLIMSTRNYLKGRKLQPDGQTQAPDGQMENEGNPI